MPPMTPFRIVLLLFLFSSVVIRSQELTIDENMASVTFVFSDDDVDGSLDDFEFTGSIDLNNVSQSSFSGRVAMKTLDTNNWLRDRHLRAKKYFNAKAFPYLSFESTGVSSDSEEIKVTGDLTIKGKTKEVVFRFVNEGSKLTGTAFINTHDFDIKIHKERDRNEVSVSITLPYSQE